MADYVRTGKDPQGRRVGQRADGSVEVITPWTTRVAQAAPVAFHEALRQAPMDAMASFIPGGSLARSVGAIPRGGEKPALSMVGGLLGSSMGPGGTIAGSGLGSSAGEALSQLRGGQANLGQVPLEGVKAAGMTALGLGVGSAVTGGAFKAMPFLAKSGLGRTGIGALSGAASGAAMNPKHPFQGAMLGGGAGGAVQGIAEGVHVLGEGLGPLLSKKSMATLGERGQQEINDFRWKQTPTAYKAKLQSLPGTHDVSQEMAALEKLRASSPTVHDAVDRAMAGAEGMGDTSLMEMLTNPASRKSASAYQVKQLQTTLEQTPKIFRSVQRLNRGGTNAGAESMQRMGTEDFGLKALADSLESRLVKAYPKQYSGISETYGRGLETHKTLEPKFMPKTSDTTIREGFGGSRVDAMAKEALTPKTYGKIKNTQRLVGVNPFVIAGRAVRRVFGR